MYEVPDPQDYCTLEEVKAHIPEGDLAQDPIISELISRVSRYIDRYKRVPDSYYNNGGDYAAATVHPYDGKGERQLWIDCCTEIESIYIRESDGTLTAWVENTDFYTWPYDTEWIARLDINGDGPQGSWPGGQRNILISAKWGAYRATPEAVKEAAIIMVSRLLARGQQMFRDTGAIVELARLTYAQAMDPEAKAILDSVPGRVNVG